MRNEKPEKGLTYEQAYKRLEEVVEKLESGTPTLEESLRLFEEASALRQKCEELLNRAEAVIKQVTTDAQGRVVEQPYQVGDTSEDASR